MRRGYLTSICRRMPITRQPYFLPTQITGCSLWLDAADSSTVTGTTTVTAWTDKSGNAYNGTVVNASVGSPVAPSYLTNSINGLSAMTMSGTSYFTGSTNVNSTTLTAFFLGNCVFGTGGSSQQRILGLGVTGLDDYSSTLRPIPLSVISGGTQLLAYRNANMASATVVSGTNFIGCCLFDGTTNFMYKDGTLGTQTASSGTFTTSIYGVGSDAGTQFMGGTSSLGTNCLVGKIGELIVYNTALNTSQRQQVESYLGQKWGLTASLISGHPGLNKIIHRNLQTTFSKTPYFVKFSPTQIVGCTHWFDATDSSTITLSSGSLTQWNDKSGNGRNLTAVSGFANATVSSAYQNGLNVFNFSGNGLYRTAAGNVSYPLDVYIIVALKSLTTHVDVLGMGDTSVDNFNSLTFAESAASRWHNGSSGGGRQTISTSNETSLSFLLLQWSLANSNYLLRRNGTQLIQASRTYSFNNSATSIFQIGFRHTDNVYGTQANFRGYIGEIIVFNNQIGTTDRQKVESYLAQKWGLVSSLPAGHLNATFPVGSPTAIQAFVPSIRPAVLSIPFIGGGSASSSGIFSIRTFLTTGQLILSKRISATILVVGGGGGGGSAGVQTGGGGAGGAVFVSSPVTITPGIYTVTVGTGGGINTNGTNSTFLSYTGVGGGGGGNWINGAGKTGGCGGGGSGEGGSGAAGSQGFGGANGRGQFTCGGGGGGMGQAGKQPADGSPSSGGNGLQYSITGSSVYYAGGGAGGFNGASTGGLGGGGDKTLQGTDGLGGGGGSGARGGNGVVILSFVFL